MRAYRDGMTGILGHKAKFAANLLEAVKALEPGDVIEVESKTRMWRPVEGSQLVPVEVISLTVALPDDDPEGEYYDTAECDVDGYN